MKDFRNEVKNVQKAIKADILSKEASLNNRVRNLLKAENKDLLTEYLVSQYVLTGCKLELHMIDFKFFVNNMPDHIQYRTTKNKLTGEKMKEQRVLFSFNSLFTIINSYTSKNGLKGVSKRKHLEKMQLFYKKAQRKAIGKY